eukprot:CAMPEP_0114691292 /NCGR_PEP_ID=MMETSP0191-20121206/66675_1 /TAXON_ID=126664 /ORGANISM="Sorites sp." /LENGTH=65 /DNA_ID=CAMNT_0001982315 /DNA_START=58 /DNA_END=252 /DNA_ORIENTATION=+
MGGCESKATSQHEIQVDTGRHESFKSLSTKTVEKFGWIPDTPDYRDLHMTFKNVAAPSHTKKKSE